MTLFPILQVLGIEPEISRARIAHRLRNCSSFICYSVCLCMCVCMHVCVPSRRYADPGGGMQTRRSQVRPIYISLSPVCLCMCVCMCVCMHACVLSRSSVFHKVLRPIGYTWRSYQKKNSVARLTIFFAKILAQRQNIRKFFHNIDKIEYHK